MLHTSLSVSSTTPALVISDFVNFHRLEFTSVQSSIFPHVINAFSLADNHSDLKPILHNFLSSSMTSKIEKKHCHLINSPD